MAPNRWHPHACRQCGHKGGPVHRISARGLCYHCGEVNLRASIKELRRREGPAYERWAARLAWKMDRITTPPSPD